MKKKLYLEDGDDVKLRFKKDSIVEVFEYEDAELDDAVEEQFKKGEEIEVIVCGFDGEKIDIQFGDGSIAFIRLSTVNVVEINGEPWTLDYISLS